MTDGLRIAKRVALERQGITVDGERLPFHVGEDVQIVRDGGRIVGVALTILCDEVTIGAGDLGKVAMHDVDHRSEVEVIRDLTGVAIRIVGDGTPTCDEHEPRQHRDARPPWCSSCGLTAAFAVPTGRLG